jgi:cellulose synthase operon protein C
VTTTIFQFWHCEPPADVTAIMKTWTKLNPTFPYQFFDDAAAQVLIEAKLGHRAASAYRSCRLPVMKSDLFRMCAIYTFGGLYVDAAFRCIQPIETLLSRAKRGMLTRRWRNQIPPEIGWATPTGFMFFREARDSVLAAVIDRVFENVLQRRSNNPWVVCGPASMSELYMHALNSGDGSFDGVEVLELAQLSEYAQMETPVYKLQPDHWFAFHQRESIFTDVII